MCTSDLIIIIIIGENSLSLFIFIRIYIENGLNEWKNKKINVEFGRMLKAFQFFVLNFLLFVSMVGFDFVQKINARIRHKSRSIRDQCTYSNVDNTSVINLIIL